MRILLAYKSHAAGAADPYTSLLPVGLGYINACLRKKGFQSRIANLSGSGWKKAETLLIREKADILGVSQFTHNRLESLMLARLAKKLNPGCFVVFGGPHATHRATEILDQERAVDAVILGEGEETFLELAGSLAAKEDPIDMVRGIAFRGGNGVVRTPPAGALRILTCCRFPPHIMMTPSALISSANWSSS